MNIGKIAVGTDFSKASEEACHQAVSVARHTGAEVVLLHVGAVIELAEEYPELRQWGESAFRARRDQLAALTERLAGQGVAISQAIHDGTPAEALCDAAAELGADLIAVGSHGAGSALERFLLGSVSERVVRISDLPVLISRSAAGEGGFRKVLVPVDFGEISDREVELALALAAADAEVELFHAWRMPPGLVKSLTMKESPLIAELRESLGGKAAEKLDQLLLRHRKSGVHLYYEHAEGVSARDAILDRLEDTAYDLVVVGSHGRRGVRRWLAGSVAEGVARAAPCSVVVVKPEG